MTNQTPGPRWNPLATMAEAIHQTADDHGFWPDNDAEHQALGRMFKALEHDMNGDAEGNPGALRADYGTLREFLLRHSGRNMGEMLMLQVSELAEALEEDRTGGADVPLAEWRCSQCGLATGSIDPESRWQHAHRETNQHLKWGGSICFGEFKPEGILVELMDCVVRILDTSFRLCADRNIDAAHIDEVIGIKMAYNDGRPYKHGKEY